MTCKGVNPSEKRDLNGKADFSLGALKTISTAKKERKDR